VDAPIPSFGNGRYVVLRKLGSGGSADVFEARDSSLDRTVAVKRLKPEAVDPDLLNRFLAECRTIASLSHPNVTAVFDVGVEGSEPYVVLEMVGGGDLRRRINQAPGHRLSPSEAIRIASELGRALDHAHRAGVLHRDIKPENVMLTPLGEAKLTDFGLAVRIDRVRSEPGTVVGTVAYLSPEAARGRSTDARSDLYSLGVVLYEMVAGRPPFSGTETELLYAHLQEAPRPPREVNPEIPIPLQEVILSLLEKDPDRRPSTAAAFLQVLADVETPRTAPEFPADLERRVAPRSPGPLVGRGPQLHRLEALVGQLGSGSGGVLMITGEAGIGKSRLAEEVSAIAQDCHAAAVVGFCSPGGDAPIFSPWVQIVRGVTGGLSAETLFDVVGGYGSALAYLMPEIRGRPTSGTVSTQATVPSRFDLFEAVAELLVRSSRRQPLVVVVEDLHWADEASLKLLEHVNRATTRERLLLVGTYRPEDAGAPGPLPDALYELNRVRQFERMPLGPLGSEEVRELVTATLGVQRVESRLVSAVNDRSSGNPFFVKELVRGLAETQEVRVANETAEWTGEAVPLPETVRHLLERRVDRLSAASRELLRSASVLGPRFELTTLGSLGDASSSEILARLEETLHASLLTEREVGTNVEIAFSDYRVRDFLYESMSTHRRRELHRRAAAVLEERGGASAEDLAYHYRRAGLAEPARRYLRQAAEEAMILSSGDPESYGRAIERYEQAAALPSGPGAAGQRRLLVELGKAYGEAGRVAEAHQTFLKTRALQVTPAEEMATEIWLAATLQTLEDLPAARARLDPALRVLGAARTSEAAEGLSVLAVVLLAEGDPHGSTRAAERSLAIAETLGDRRQVFDALSNLFSACLASYDWESCGRWSLQELEIAKKGLTPFGRAQASVDRAIHGTRVHPDPASALEHSGQAVALLRKIRNPGFEARARVVRAQTLRDAGRWVEAGQEVQAGLALAAEAKNDYVRAHLRLVAAQLQGFRGELGGAEQELRDLWDRSKTSPQYREDFAAQAAAALAWVLIERGETEEGRTVARAAFGEAGGHRCGWCADSASTVVAMAEAADGTGSPEWYGRAIRHIEEHGSPLAKAIVCAPQARWARLHGTPAEAGFSDAEEYLRSIGRRFDLASTILEHGQTIGSLGDRPRADARLDEALQIFLELGAKKRAQMALGTKMLIRA
jgi:eukaryotic-like serine/threonine-protein kinase